MEEHLLASLGAADRSGQMREQIGARWMLAEALALGPVPASECIDRCEELVSLHGIEVPGVRMALALFAAMAGRFDEARAMNDRALRVIEEQIRARRLLKFVAAARGAMELIAGDLISAEHQFRASVEADRAPEGERDDLSQSAARLAFVLWRQHRDEEAAELAELSSDAARAESVAAQALSSAARARAEANTELARKAIDGVPDEMLNLRADLLVELATLLRELGDARGAKDAMEEAAGLYDRKGNLAAMARLSG